MLISDEIDKIALLYKKDLQRELMELREFPRYYCTLSSEISNGTALHVYEYNENLLLIPVLRAEFSLNSVKIECRGNQQVLEHVDIINYTDPRLTEDILSRIILEYDKIR